MSEIGAVVVLSGPVGVVGNVGVKCDAGGGAEGEAGGEVLVEEIEGRVLAEAKAVGKVEVEA